MSLGVLTMGQGIQQQQPLTDTAQLHSFGPIAASSPLALTASDFEYCRALITHDLDWYKASNAQVLRPLLFIVSATSPLAGDWADGTIQLIDPGFNYRPNIVCVATTSAGRQLADQLTTSRVLQADGLPPQVAFERGIDSVFSILTESCRSSKLTIPNDVPGFTVV